MHPFSETAEVEHSQFLFKYNIKWNIFISLLPHEMINNLISLKNTDMQDQQQNNKRLHIESHADQLHNFHSKTNSLSCPDMNRHLTPGAPNPSLAEPQGPLPYTIYGHSTSCALVFPPLVFAALANNVQ